MRTVGIVLVVLICAAVLVGLGGVVVIYAGIFNVAANEPHWDLTYWVMDKARVRSIRVHAAGLSPPAGYDEQSKLVSAVGHFSEHCAMCHGAPGTKRAEVAEGMYPRPPDLKGAATRYSAGELFWILKSGIKMSGMPSMASDGDDMLWATVALLQKLPQISDDEYNQLWLLSQANGGTDMDHGSMKMDEKGQGQKAGDPSAAQHDHSKGEAGKP